MKAWILTNLRAMMKAKILANVSNILVTIFLLILIPMTIMGTYLIVINSDNIKENTRFRIESVETIDSLRTQLRIQKYINDVHREYFKEIIE